MVDRAARVAHSQPAAQGGASVARGQTDPPDRTAFLKVALDLQERTGDRPQTPAETLIREDRDRGHGLS